jgi:hypothetical protein
LQWLLAQTLRGGIYTEKPAITAEFLGRYQTDMIPLSHTVTRTVTAWNYLRVHATHFPGEIFESHSGRILLPCRRAVQYTKQKGMMMHTTFATLMEELMSLSGCTEPHRVSNLLHLEIDDTVYTLMAGQQAHAHQVLYFADYGAIPRNNDRLSIVERLLELNLFMIGAATPSFCINADTGHAILKGQCDLRSTSASALLTALREFSGQAKVWRKTYFLELNKKSSSSPARRLWMAAQPV